MKNTQEIISYGSPSWSAFTDLLDMRIRVQGGCKHTASAAIYVLELMARESPIDIPASLAWMEKNGGHCDCEILMNCDPPYKILREKMAKGEIPTGDDEDNDPADYWKN